MESILKAIEKKRVPINPAVVISNRADAKGLDIAQRLGVATEVVSSVEFEGTRQDYDEEVIRTLERYGVSSSNGLVCLAGFMRIIGSEFVKKYKNRILNIHPSLLPSFPGLHAQRQAMDYGVKYTGCTVHLVDAGTDSGPVVIQAIVKIQNNDTVESLSRRILEEEHRIYPEAISLFVRGRIRVAGRKTIIDQESVQPKK